MMKLFENKHRMEFNIVAKGFSEVDLQLINAPKKFIAWTKVFETF